MPRERSPNRDKAKELYLASGGSMKLKDIAAELGVSDNQIRKWKNQDNWDDDVNSNVTNQKPRSKDNVTKRIGAPKGNKNAVGNKGGAPPGNKNAVGNSGGPGGPVRNDKAVTHGLFRQFLPDDEETRQIYDAVGSTSPLDMLWENIQIKFTAIIRAQRIMFVTDKDEMIKELKKRKYEVHDVGGEDGGVKLEQVVTEEEYEFQFSWDRHATFLNAQARAMSTLSSMIRQYEEMLRLGWGDEEQRLKVEKLKAEVANLKKDAVPVDPVVFKDDLHE